ncbi:Hypothetical predicted protein, partial [Scomber scombrus]
ARGLMPHSREFGPTNQDRLNIMNHARQEYTKRKTELEKGEKRKFGPTKTALEKAQKIMARTNCLLMHFNQVSPEEVAYICPVITEKAKKTQGSDLKSPTPASPASAPPAFEPPPYYEKLVINLPSLPAPPNSPIQALVVRVKGGQVTANVTDGLLHIDKTEKDEKVDRLLKEIKYLTVVAGYALEQSQDAVKAAQRIAETQVMTQPQACSTPQEGGGTTQAKRDIVVIAATSAESCLQATKIY